MLASVTDFRRGCSQLPDPFRALRPQIIRELKDRTTLVPQASERAGEPKVSRSSHGKLNFMPLEKIQSRG